MLVGASQHRHKPFRDRRFRQFPQPKHHKLLTTEDSSSPNLSPDPSCPRETQEQAILEAFDRNGG
jgi:hypothetical protein